MREDFRTSFAMHKSSLLAKIDEILQNEMVHAPGRPQSERFEGIFYSFGMNLKRKDKLKSISNGLNKQLASALEAHIADILMSIRRTFEVGFEQLVTSMHKVLSGTTTLKNMEADDALGITASQQYSRFCAVVITALREAARKQENLEFITTILNEEYADFMAGLDQKVSEPLRLSGAAAATSSHATLTDETQPRKKQRGDQGPGTA
eukprot:4890842-Prymnesium_polylepis.1